MMHLKGTISWEGLCFSFGYLVAMVTTDVISNQVGLLLYLLFQGSNWPIVLTTWG